MRYLLLLLFFPLLAFAQADQYDYTYSWNGQYSASSCSSVAASLDGAYPIGGGATRICTGTASGPAGIVRACASNNMNICNDINFVGVAKPPPNTCPSAGSPGGNYTYTTASLEGNPGTYGEYGGDCVVREVDRFCTGTASGTYHCVAKTEYTGNPCPSGGCDGAGTTTPPPAPEPDASIPPNAGPCAAGYYYGTVNGQTTCVPGASTTTSSAPKTTTTTKADGSGTTVTSTGTTSTGTTSNGTPTTTTTWGTETMRWDVTQPSQNVGAPPAGATVPTAAGETKTTTVTNPDGSVTKHEVTKKADGTYDVKSTNGTVEKTENTTSCTGSACTTSTTKTENGAVTETTTGEGSKDGICKETPANPVCGTGSEGMFGGSCSAGFICEGDAVQCAMAKKQHESLCALMENPTGESQLYDAEKAKTGNVTGDNPNNGTVAIGAGLFDYSSALGGGSCIPDKTITVMGQSISIPFSTVCPWLLVLGNLLVAVSSLVAMRIITRG